MKRILVLLILIYTLTSCHKEEIIISRNDEAIKITHAYPRSCQNPCFSPDGEYIVYTRFLNGYNLSPSEIVKIRIDGTDEKVIVSSANSGNVTVPFGSWAGDKICFASDRAGMADEIWVVNDDGTNLQQITTHSEDNGIYFIEPVFNPQNPNQIAFEYVTGEIDESATHQIAFLDVLTAKITLLTDQTFDDRLPSWSNDGSKILFQRNEYGQDEGWEVVYGNINTTTTTLNNIRSLDFGNDFKDYTDCSWNFDDTYIISSSYTNEFPIPNIWAFPLDSKFLPIQISSSEFYEDGAGTQSKNGNMIAFESHYGESEEQSSEIWIIK